MKIQFSYTMVDSLIAALDTIKSDINIDEIRIDNLVISKADNYGNNETLQIEVMQSEPASNPEAVG